MAGRVEDFGEVRHVAGEWQTVAEHPVAVGYSPVRRDGRAGAHTGSGVIACWTSPPSRAGRPNSEVAPAQLPDTSVVSQRC